MGFLADPVQSVSDTVSHVGQVIASSPLAQAVITVGAATMGVPPAVTAGLLGANTTAQTGNAGAGLSTALLSNLGGNLTNSSGLSNTIRGGVNSLLGTGAATGTTGTTGAAGTAGMGGGTGMTMGAAGAGAAGMGGGTGLTAAGAAGTGATGAGAAGMGGGTGLLTAAGVGALGTLANSTGSDNPYGLIANTANSNVPGFGTTATNGIDLASLASSLGVSVGTLADQLGVNLNSLGSTLGNGIGGLGNTLGNSVTGLSNTLNSGLNGLGGMFSSGLSGLGTTLGNALTSNGVLSTAANTAGAALNAQAAKDAAQTQADAQIRAAQIAADAAKFRPIGVTTNFGKSQFGYDANGNLSSAGYTLNPQLQGQQNQLMGASQGMLDQFTGAKAATAPMGQAAQSMMTLGQGYLATDPQAQAAKYYADQQAILAPQRASDMAALQAQMQAQGRGGFAIGGGVGGQGAANPQLQAMLNAQMQQNTQLSANATQGGMDYAKFGGAMVGAGGDMLSSMYDTQKAAYSPYYTAISGANTLENMGQGAMTLGTNLGNTATAASAAAGRLQGQGMTDAAATMAPANAYSPWGAMLSGAGQATAGYKFDPMTGKAL